MKMFPFRSAST